MIESIDVCIVIMIDLILYLRLLSKLAATSRTELACVARAAVDLSSWERVICN